jgi:metal-responsive CopG/Arc/MetJ family transcriptional regulator
MKRTTISLPDDLAAAIEREARREGVSVSEVVRKAVEAKLGRTNLEGKRHLPFASLGRSGFKTTARDIDKILADEWTKENLIDRNR